MPGMHARWNRRRVLGTASAGLMSALAPIGPPSRAQVKPDRPAPALVIRRNIYTLDPAGPEIASLRRGVAVMQQLSIDNPDDPRGWQFQANMHGAPPDVPENHVWRQCQHGSHF